MLLWTWQNKDFSLADDDKVESFKHSFYLKKIPDPKEKEKHKSAYRMLFNKLGNQLIWCFANYNEAVNENSIVEFEKEQYRVLWEIDVPEKDIKWYCPVVWNKLRTGILKMNGSVGIIYNSPYSNYEKHAPNFREEFNNYWSKKNEDELLDLMLLEKMPIFDFGSPNTRTWGCSEVAIITHPVGKDNIKKNPLEIGKWWPTLDTVRQLNINEDLIKKIPCPNCPGR